MQLVRTHNFGTATGEYLIVHEHEWKALWGLPAWTTRLFLCLVAFSDFKRGTVRTSYGELLNALQPDQPAHGGRRLPGVSLKQVREALRSFENLLILGRDKGRNEEQQALFLQLAPRSRVSVPAPDKGRGKGRGAPAQNADEHEENSKQHESSGGGLGQVFQENFLIPPTPKSAKLSTGQDSPEEGEKQAPRGGQDTAPAAHAPRRDGVLTGRAAVAAAQAIADRLRGKKQAPPRGQAPTPPGARLQRPETALAGPADDG